MKGTVALLTFGIFSCITATSQAQQMSSDVAAVLRASLTAQVGSVPPSDVTLSGTVEHIAGSDDETVPYLFKALSSGSTKTETSLAAGALVEVRQVASTGSTGIWMNGEGVKHPIAGQNLMTDSTWCFPALIVQRLLNDPQAVVISLGTQGGVVHLQAYETQPATIAASAAAELQHLSQVDLYIDASTNFPVAFAINIHPDTNALVDVPVYIDFSNYQTANGITMPMHVQEYLNSSLASDIRIQTVAPNTGLTLSDFATN